MPSDPRSENAKLEDFVSGPIDVGSGCMEGRRSPFGSETISRLPSWSLSDPEFDIALQLQLRPESGGAAHQAAIYAAVSDLTTDTFTR